MNDTITLPRSVVEQALEDLEMTINYVQSPTRRVDMRDSIEALRAALEQPQVEQKLDAFYEWWHMRPSLTRLQAWLLWKDEQKQLPAAIRARSQE